MDAPSGGGGARIAAAALAGAPVGFAVGAVISARFAPNAGGLILACGLIGALAVAAAMALVARLLPPKPVRIATLVVGAGSFALLAYMVQDFISDRVDEARALADAYARLPWIEVTLTAENDAGRAPFSELVYDSATREYVATRPGGWVCRGTLSSRRAMALYAGAQAAEADLDTVATCGLRVVVRFESAPPLRACGYLSGAQLFAAADDIVKATERKASCRRPQ